MRLLAPLGVLGCGILALACQQIADGLGLGGGATDAGAGATDAGAVDASVLGGGCGTEQNSGNDLCVAVSTCPDVVVDTELMPHCGFRVRGAALDLVCACGTSLCPMGTFATCAEAKTLLSQQTEQGVCVQLAEGRCSQGTAVAPSTSATSVSPSGSNTACDRQCMKDCGGGAACASVCNCS